MQRLFYAPPLPRTRLPFRSVIPRPHDASSNTLHSSRLALQLRVRNTRFHDIDPLLFSHSLNHGNWHLAIPLPVPPH